MHPWQALKFVRYAKKFPEHRGVYLRVAKLAIKPRMSISDMLMAIATISEIKETISEKH